MNQKNKDIIKHMALTDTINILNNLRPWDVMGHTKVRVGNTDGDGGYALLDILRPNQKVYSFGIGGQTSFDRSLADRGHDIFMFDHTIDGIKQPHPRFYFTKMGLAGKSQPEKSLLSLVDHIDRLNHADADMILKMDVEGHEWAAIDMTESDVLARFEQITLEAHGFYRMERDAWRRRAIRVLEKLNRTHTLFHVHANNHAPIMIVNNLPVVNTAEFSFVRTDLVNRVPSRTLFPTEIDPPNVASRPETLLWFFPFLPIAATERELADQMAATLARVERA